MARRPRTLSVPLTPQAERFVDALVRSGRFGSAGDVVHEAIDILREREAMRSAHLERLRREVDVGLKALHNGDVSDFDDAAVARIRTKGRRLLDAHRRRTASQRRKAS